MLEATVKLESVTDSPPLSPGQGQPQVKSSWLAQIVPLGAETFFFREYDFTHFFKKKRVERTAYTT